LKRVLVLLMLLALVVGLVTIVGCGDKKTVETPYGDETVEEDGGKITTQTDEGDYTYDYSDQAPSEADLGAPIYPDAEYVAGSGGVVTGSGPEGEFTTAGAEFTTNDSFDDVVGFYTDELGDPFVVDQTTNEATWMSDLTDQSVVTVTVTDEGSDVRIYIGRLGGNE
jgi:predicted small lipoprotein YifL